jgi:DNA gyrase/topoisomerase IV subunit B
LLSEKWKTVEISIYKDHFKLKFDAFWFDLTNKNGGYAHLNVGEYNDLACYEYAFIIPVALSEKFVIKTQNKELQFAKGVLEKEIDKINSNFEIVFYPDKEFFDLPTLPYMFLANELKVFSFLNTERKFVLFDKTADIKFDFQSKNGLLDYFHEQVLGYHTLTNPFIINYQDEKYELEVVFSYYEKDKYFAPQGNGNNNFIACANGFHCLTGGSHEKAFFKAIKEINKTFEFNQKIGIIGVLNLKMHKRALQFEGSTKSKLYAPDAEKIITNAIKKAITATLLDNPEKQKEILQGLDYHKYYRK